MDNYSKKEVLVQRVVFNGPSWTKRARDEKNRKIVFPSLVAFSSESGAKVKLKLNRRLDNEE